MTARSLRYPSHIQIRCKATLHWQDVFVLPEACLSGKCLEKRNISSLRVLAVNEEAAKVSMFHCSNQLAHIQALTACHEQPPEGVRRRRSRRRRRTKSREGGPIIPQKKELICMTRYEGEENKEDEGRGGRGGPGYAPGTDPSFLESWGGPVDASGLSTQVVPGCDPGARPAATHRRWLRITERDPAGQSGWNARVAHRRHFLTAPRATHPGLSATPVALITSKPHETRRWSTTATGMPSPP